MTRNDVPLGKGQCDIRLQVDGEVEVSVRGQTVSIRTISGREARDDGSECNQPLPCRGDLRGFNFEVIDKRGEIALLAQPSSRNGSAAIVRIRDSQSGEGRYHFRLSWQMNGGMPGGGGPGRDGPRGDYDQISSPPRGSFGFAEAMRVCQDAVVSKVVDQYHTAALMWTSKCPGQTVPRNDYAGKRRAARTGPGPYTFIRRRLPTRAVRVRRSDR